MVDRIGQQLGNYRLMRLLGRGGFAEVYLGQHLRLNMQAAIKVLHTQLADAADIQNFHREAQTIASLIHPHIVRILDFDVKDGVPFLVMDYAPNGSLRQRHPKGVPLPLPTIVSYVKQVANALQYAHNQKLIHRDIKPENMLLGRHSEVLLSDFGTAIISQSSRYQGTQDMVGTIAYMAPEQIAAHPLPASDQYALGVVVYEWLCGEYPFQGSLSEIVAKHTMMSPPSLRGKVPTFSPELEQVVIAALAKDPRQRFASVQGFAAALEQASRGTRMIVPASTPMVQLLQASAKTSLVIKGPQPAATNPLMTPPGRMAQAPVTMRPPGQSRQQVNTPNAFNGAGLHHQGISRRTVILGLGMTGLVIAVGTLLSVVPVDKTGDHLFNPFRSISNPVQTSGGNPSSIAQQDATATVTHQDGYAPGSSVAPLSAGGAYDHFAFGQCTYYASLRYHELTGQWVPWMGNAYQWAYEAGGFGWVVSSKPKVPSIIVLQPGVQGAGWFGQVAIVESINPDGSVSTSTWGWYGPGGAGWGRLSIVTFRPGPGVSFVWHP